MEQQFINLTNKRIAALYQEVKDLLFAQESYAIEVDTSNVQLYFTYHEASLELPYNRLYSISNFTSCDDYQVSDRMYPFALLNPEAKEKIREILTQGVSFAEALQVNGIDKEYRLVSKEKHLELLDNKNSERRRKSA